MTETMDNIAIIVMILIALALTIGLIVGGCLAYRERRRIWKDRRKNGR